jgi:protein-arginine kinase activator protein McsA
MKIGLKRSSKALEFERAADIRDEIQRLKRLLPDEERLLAKKAPLRSR